VFGQLLRPCLGLDIAAATRPAEAFFTAGAGVRVSSVLSVTGLVEMLLTPSVERDPLGQPIPEPDVVPLVAGRFGDQLWRQSTAILDPGRKARRLSAILARARDVDPELPSLVMLRVLHAVGTAVATARNQGDPAVLLAVDDGVVLRDGEFGGADLLVAWADVDAELDAFLAAPEDVA
jgi:hypothetical protein